MKTTKLITALVALNFILFISVDSVAKPFNRHTGDIIKTETLNQIAALKNNFGSAVSTALSTNEFSHLRFDVTKYINESETAEVSLNLNEYLRFDVSKYAGTSESEISEMPLENEFEYLRFDVTNFAGNANLSEMPESGFEYLHFDVNKYSGSNAGETEELPLD